MSMKAFTLIETLVAIAIVTIAIVGPFQVVQGVLQSSYIARDQLIAAAQAQEGMEYVRQIRDSNSIFNTHHGGGRTWLTGLDGTGGPDCYANACVVDPGQQSVTSCGATSCSPASWPLYLSGSSNLYNEPTAAGSPGTGAKTRFTRQVRLTFISTTETLVTVTVSWDYHGTHSVVLVESLRNWL
jgi:prepilin-type N-terminal cleavage/methylation domain-containing protein